MMLTKTCVSQHYTSEMLIHKTKKTHTQTHTHVTLTKKKDQYLLEVRLNLKLYKSTTGRIYMYVKFLS